MKRILSLPVLLLACVIAFAQKPFEPVVINPQYVFKVSLADQTVFSLPSIRLHADYLLFDSDLPDYLSADIGYTYYSVDEDVKASGFIAGLRLNSTRFSSGNRKRGISPGLHFQKVYLNDYLKVDKTIPGLGTYYAYEKMNYTKNRVGLSLDFYRQVHLVGGFFLESAIGLGMIYMKTNVPEGVSQQTFTNGLSWRRETLLPNVTFSLKVGYALFR